MKSFAIVASLIAVGLAAADISLQYWLKREREYIRTLQLESDERLTREIAHIKEKLHPKVVFRVAGRADGTFAVEQWITSPYWGKVQVDQFKTVEWAKIWADTYREEYEKEHKQ